MVEDILKKDGLSFALLRKLSFRTKLEGNLTQAISCLDEPSLIEELKSIVVWYDSSNILSGLPIDYRIKSLQAILRKYQRASGKSRVERVFNDILGFRTLCDNYEEILRLREAKNISVADMSNGKTHDDGYRGVYIYYQYGHRHYPIEIQYNTYYDRQMNNWLHKYVWSKHHPANVGITLRREYERGRIRTECECEEVLRDVLSDCKEIR